MNFPALSQIALRKVLIIEDSRQTRALMATILQNHYQLSLAKDGIEGLEIAKNDIPDLVITDLMMPKLDGLALTKELKSDPKTAHIPIIMLTSITDESAELESYRNGVDVFMNKPFSKDHLVLRIGALLRNCNIVYQSAIENYRIMKNQSVKEFRDKASFEQKLNELIQIDLGNPELKVGDIANNMSMSISTFERKMKEFFDATPKLYIRDIRLDHAAEMLKSRKGKIKKIARHCGFDNDSYFALCYREKFGHNPSETKPTQNHVNVFR